MYTIKQASLKSGVGIPLLRAWERRYGVVHPTRTAAGYRLYDDEAIDRLRAMRHLVESGWAPREAGPRIAAAGVEELEQLQGLPAEPYSGTAVPGEEARRLVSQIVDTAVNLDAESLERALDTAFSSARFEPAVQHIVLPAMVEVGRAWADGRLDVAGEHATSAAVLRRLGAAFQAAGARLDAPVVMVGLPSGARHELAALAFATAARRSGLNVVYLGADVPLESWLTAVRGTAAVAVVLGAVMPADAESITRVFRELAKAAPAILRVVGGRHAASTQGAHLVLPEDMTDAVAALAQGLPGVRPAAAYPNS